MKTSLRLLAAVFVLSFASLIFADDFKSMTFSAADGTVSLPRIHGDQVMVIRNFTQENTPLSRGTVSVTKPPNTGTPVKVLAAAVLTSPTPDVINSVVIAGPADVSVTCGAATGSCFISFKKD